VSAPLKAAWVLTAFVIVAGIVGWVVTDRAVFAVFLVMGVLTAVGAVITGRAERAARPAAPKEDPSA
jgi:dolichol kinase